MEDLPVDQNKCKHEGCHCQGAEIQADGYCSDNCRHQKMDGGKCGCGHPDCM
jgi:hypothetical protein